MSSKAPFLLSDEQMRQFITQGFLILKTNFSSEFHKNLHEQLNYVYEKEGNPGNNLLPRIRELQKVFVHPVITGALYGHFPHCRLSLSAAGSEALQGC